MKFLIILSLFSCSYCQNTLDCNLPDTSLKSICIKFYLCDSLWLPIKNAQTSKLPIKSEDSERLKKHVCSGNLVCCPDNAVIPTPPTVTTTTPSSLDILKLQPIRPKIEDLLNHKNLKLVNEKSCGVANTDKIIGGEEAKLREFPWMALLKYKLRLDDDYSFGCGGALITSRYVVTAAHCLNGDLVQVRLGEHSIQNVRDCVGEDDCNDEVQDIEIETKIKYPGYDKHKRVNDLAMLKLKASADLKKNNVKTICLPIKAENQVESLDKKFLDNMRITGWGRVADDTQSDVLLKAFVPYVNREDCVRKYNSFPGVKITIQPTYLCAGGHNKTDTCKGDSGGPIQTYSLSPYPKVFLYGVVAWGLSCTNADLVFPGIYTNIAYYADWILDNISEN